MIVIPSNVEDSYYDNGACKIAIQDNPSAYHRLKSFYGYFSTTPIPKIVSDRVLPPGVLYADNSIVVYEKPPCIKNYFHIHSQVESIKEEDVDNQYVYSIPLPWQVYVVKYGGQPDELYIEDVYMYFSNSSIQSFDQPIYLAPITNFYANGKLCRPYFDNMSDVVVPNNDVLGLIELSYNWVWNSGYNADLTESLLQAFIWGYGKGKPIFSGIPSSIKYNPIGTYYTTNESSHVFFASWEKTPIEEILFTQWPTPNTSERYMPYYSDVFSANRLEWSNNNSSLMNHSDLCCEDCQYYDEDGDLVEDICSYEDCECHSEYQFTTDNIYEVLRTSGAFDRTLSLREAILSLNLFKASSNIDFKSSLTLFD